MKSIKEDKLYQLLIKIKKRPLLYLKEKSLKELDAYMAGFVMGIYEKMHDECKEQQFSWYKKFVQYIKENCINASNVGDEIEAIFADGYDEYSGFDYYYELLERFIQEKVYDVNYFMPNGKSALTNSREIRAFKLNKQGIYMMVCRYIDRHFKELVDGIDIISKKELMPNASYKINWENEGESFVCIVFEKELEITKEIEERIVRDLKEADFFEGNSEYKIFNYDELLL